MSEKKPREFPVRGTIIGLLVGIVVLLIALPIMVSSVSISGEEFSPSRFQERNFSYARWPWPKWRLTKTTVSVASSPCSKYVLSELNTISGEPIWQTSKVDYGSQSVVHGPTILLKYLKQKNADGSSCWDKWSMENPELAKILWPIVQEAALRDVYWCMPDLFRAAEQQQQAKLLRRELKFIVLKAVLESLQRPKSHSLSTLPIPSELPEVSKDWAKSFASDLAMESELSELIDQFP